MAEELEQFQLPDGTMVATGNIVPDGEIPYLFAEFPEARLLDDKDVEKLMKAKDYKKDRIKHGKYLINQSSIGKCNASAAAGGLHQIREQTGQKHVALADNHIYYHINDGRDIGSLLHKGMEFIKDVGCAPRVLPSGQIGHLVYNKSQVNSAVRQEADKAASRFKAWEPYKVPDDYEGFRRTIATCIARNYPIVMAWHVSNASMRLSNGYVDQGRGPGNHATLFHSGKWVGGNDIIHPDLKNSWGPTQDALYGPKGPSWGEAGYGLMTMQSAFQCRKFHDFYVITGSVEDPENSNL